MIRPPRPRYFGAPWPSGICDDGDQVETPLGASCLMCDDLIDEDDHGWWMNHLTAQGPTSVPVHRECALRSAVGSIGHLTGVCGCYLPPGESMEDPPDVSRREAALLVWEFYTRRGAA